MYSVMFVIGLFVAVAIAKIVLDRDKRRKPRTGVVKRGFQARKARAYSEWAERARRNK